MTDLSKPQRSALATVKAAQASRRAVLKSALALGAVGFLAPAFSRNAFSSSGELNWFTWEDYAPAGLVDKFQSETGIKLNVTSFSSNEDCLNKLKAASGGSGWDLTSPSIAWISAHIDSANLGVLDPAKAPNIANIFPSMMEQSSGLGAQRDGKWYALPYDWGTEALGFHTDLKLEYGKASFGDLWSEANKGKMLCRQRSIMLGTGLWMERTGDLPAGTMKKAYDDEAAFDLGYTKAAEYTIAHKDHIVNWWKGGADTQSGFQQDGAVIGMTWDGPIMQMKDQGLPYSYVAPVEGALMWLDSIALTAAASNLEQAYAFINWACTPEVGGIVSNNTGYNSCVQGFDAHVTDAFKKNFQEAYPGDAISKLWLQGTERPWFLERRQALADKISAA